MSGIQVWEIFFFLAIIIFMAQYRLELGLTSAFNSRLCKYFLLLEVGNHSQLVCQLTDFLTTPELLNLLSTSRHFYSLLKIQSIEIRILKAKLHYYEKPRTQQPTQVLLGSLPMQMNFDPYPVKGQKMKKEHQALKNFNKNIKFMKYLKKTGIAQNKETFQKLLMTKIAQSRKTGSESNQPKKPKKMYNLSPSQSPQVPSKISIQEPIQSKRIQTSISMKQSRKGPTFNPLFQRFKEIEYRIAREDYEKRKRQRQMQRPLMTMQELKKLAETDPCSRQIYYRVYIEQKERYQRQNRQKLRMKPLNIHPEDLQKFVQGEEVKKVVVVRQSLAQKFFKNIKSVIWVIWKERQTISI